MPDASTIDALTSVPWTWLLIRGSGLTAWGLLTAVVVWGLLLRTRLLGSHASPPALLRMHRWLGAVALAFLGLHLVLLLIDPVVRFTVPQMLLPFASPWQPLAVGLGTLALWALVPVAIVGRLRTRMGKSGQAWFRRTHLIAYAAWPLATAHYVLAGTDALAAWSMAALIAATAVIAAALLARAWVPAPAPARRAPAARVTPAAPAVQAAPAGDRADELASVG